MTADIERLLQRLQSGWMPDAAEIDPAVKQRDISDWDFVVDRRTRKLALWGVVGLMNHDWRDLTSEVLSIDPSLDWALCEDCFYWLYTREEGDKMRWLGG